MYTLLLSACLFVQTGPAPNQAAQDPASPDFGPFGRYVQQIDGLQSPIAVAVNDRNEIFLCERSAHRVTVVDAEGTRLRQWGSPGSGTGQFLAPQGIALGGDGAVFVTDAGNHRVQVFNAEGTYLRQWGGHGAEAGEFINPGGIAVDANRVYVADTGNHRIQVFDHHGAYLFSCGQRGGGEGQLLLPRSVTVDGAGRILVADSMNHRLHVFDNEGRPMSVLGAYGSFPGLFAYPTGLMWRNESLYIVDSRNHRIQVFDADLEFTYEWGSHALWLRDGEGRYETPTAMAIAPDGMFAVIVEPNEDRCQIISRLGDVIAEPPPPVRQRSHYGQRLRADGDLLIIPEPDLHAVDVFNLTRPTPILVGKFGVQGEGFGQLSHSSAVSVDAGRSEVFVSDIALRRIQKFRLNREDRQEMKYVPGMSRFVTAFDLAMAHLVKTMARDAMTSIIEPTVFERDSQGRFYILDSHTCRVSVINEALELVSTWGGYGVEPGRFRSPTDIAVDGTGNRIYIVDALNFRVQVFDLKGNFLFAFGSYGDGDAQFLEPFGITKGLDERLYVTDSAAHQVKVFDAEGHFIEAWGGSGENEGQLYKPMGIAADERHRILVSDYGNHRIQIFDENGRTLSMLGWRKPRVVPGESDE